MNQTERRHFSWIEKAAAVVVVLGALWGIFTWLTGDHSVAQQINSVNTRVDDSNTSIGKLDRRVVDLEHSDKDQEAHFSRVESALAQYQASSDRQFDDMRRTLSDINKKLDDMHDQLLLNGAGNRPELRKWTKP